MKQEKSLQIIAEFAQGFEGEFIQAKLLLRAAAAAGASAGKFQLVYADELATKDYKYYDLFKSLEMSDESWSKLSKYAIELGLELHLDIFGKKSLTLAESVGAAAIKLHATDLNNLSLLEAVSESSINEVYVGAGGANSDEISVALRILKAKNVTLLLGFQGYPTLPEDNHIRRLNVWRKLYADDDNVSFGFADHSSPDSHLAWGLSAMSIISGATALEKHLTLAQSMQLEDYESALDPDQFRKYAHEMRVCASAVGMSTVSSDFDMSENELKYREMIRRHVVAKIKLEEGTVLRAEHLVLKRTANPNSILDMSEAVGKKLITGIGAQEPLTSNHLCDE